MWISAVSMSLTWCCALGSGDAVLPGTSPLEDETDLAARMVAGVDAYLSRQIESSIMGRSAIWRTAAESPEERENRVALQREHLKTIIGAVDPRVPFQDLALVGTPTRPALLGRGEGYSIYAVRWPVLEGVDAEGLLLEPSRETGLHLVALPDADWTPEQLVGLTEGVPRESQFARRFAESGWRVLIPTLIDRSDTWSGHPDVRMTNQPHREWVYRAAYHMGRHIIGYEVQKVLAAVDYFTAVAGEEARIGVFGYGEGGLIALYAGALDTRILATGVSGYFGPRENLWTEPIYRNVWALLRTWGDAELAAMFAPRALFIDASPWPEIAGPPPERDGRRGAAPGAIVTPPRADVEREFQRAAKLAPDADERPRWRFHLVTSRDETDLPVSEAAIEHFAFAKGRFGLLPPAGSPALEPDAELPNPKIRLKRQFDQLNAFTQKLVRESRTQREAFWNETDASSPERWIETTRPWRARLHRELIGRLPHTVHLSNPRSRLVIESDRWRGYEVVLDVLPDVVAGGLLLVPRDVAPGERRPVVVCQHGLEGRPTSVITTEGRAARSYGQLGARLADMGFIVYAPQNPYIGENDFRVLQRKANPLGLSLMSFIVSQHEQTLGWLARLPFVDPERIGFYGLSYGGRTALHVPPILTERYALVVCSGNFNEWVVKITSISDRFSYMFTREYEMFDFNMGNVFNHAELAALIAPRPFMVERGHHDPVAIDEWVAFEYAPVRRLYRTLGIPERTEIAWFDGDHRIDGERAIAFLVRHLGPPETGPTE